MRNGPLNLTGDEMKFLAIRKWKDGGEQTMEYFNTRKECEKWINEQPWPKDDSWAWYIGEY